LEHRIGQSPGPSARDSRLNFFALLQRLEFQPKHIIDVGAHRGSWTRDAIRFFPEAQYTLVEPQNDLRESIQDLVDHGCRLNWIHAGAGDRAGILPLNLAERDDSNSFVLPASGARPSAPVQIRTINEIVGTMGWPLPDIIKIDAEGFDLKVFAGASDFHGKTEVFFIEALVCASGYENTFSEVTRRLDEAGYRLIDITDLNRTPTLGALWLCEMAFIRKVSPLLEAISSYA
jgi:FkbM family methyltransferase